MAESPVCHFCAKWCDSDAVGARSCSKCPNTFCAKCATKEFESEGKSYKRRRLAVDFLCNFSKALWIAFAITEPVLFCSFIIDPIFHACSTPTDRLWRKWVPILPEGLPLHCMRCFKRQRPECACLEADLSLLAFDALSAILTVVCFTYRAFAV